MVVADVAVGALGCSSLDLLAVAADVATDAAAGAPGLLWDYRRC